MTMVESLIEKVKVQSDPDRLGMILCHNGVVRATSRAGQRVKFLDITKNDEAWENTLAEARQMPGISAVEAHLFSGRRQIGEDVMIVVIGGDIRENLFPALEATVNRLKKVGVSKKEWPAE